MPWGIFWRARGWSGHNERGETAAPPRVCWRQHGSWRKRSKDRDMKTTKWQEKKQKRTNVTEVSRCWRSRKVDEPVLRRTVAMEVGPDLTGQARRASSFAPSGLPPALPRHLGGIFLGRFALRQAPQASVGSRARRGGLIRVERCCEPQRGCFTAGGLSVAH